MNATRRNLLAELSDLNRQYQGAVSTQQIAAICKREAEIEILLRDNDDAEVMTDESWLSFAMRITEASVEKRCERNFHRAFHGIEG